MRNRPWERVARAAGLAGADGVVVPTVFARMSALAAATGAINLGQGFPDEDPPAEVMREARDAIARGVNQYPPGRGIPALREAIARHQAHWYNLSWDPEREALVTAGATEAIAAALLALVAPGDEVVVVEPYYDEYAAITGLAQGKLVTVPARAPEFLPDPERLIEAVTDHTAVILLNTPHNPTGAMLPDTTIALALELAEKHDAIVIADEVYEHLTFARQHHSLAEFPGGRERGVTVSSAAKSLNATGWKIGWITANAELVEAILVVKQFLTFVNGAPFQPAVALGLGLPDSVFLDAAARLDRRRARITEGLEEAGFWVNRPAGSYYQIADGAPLGFTDAEQLCRELVDQVGVVAIPVSAFLADPSDPTASSLIRLAACKQDPVIEEAATRLAGFRSHSVRIDA